jgi:hypothetical protein
MSLSAITSITQGGKGKRAASQEGACVRRTRLPKGASSPCLAPVALVASPHVQDSLPAHCPFVGPFPQLGAFAASRPAACGLPFSRVRGRDATGVLLGEAPPRLLVVPGGFARKKLEALGPAGIEAVRRFVASGGAYLGICGGAGLALSDPDGLSLCPWRRAGFTNRIKHFISGHVLVAPRRPSDLIPDWLPERPRFRYGGRPGSRRLWTRFRPGGGGDIWPPTMPGAGLHAGDLDVAGLPSSTLDGWRERFGLG